VYERIARELAHRGHRVCVAHGEYANRRCWASPIRDKKDANPRRIALPLFPTPKRLAWMNSTFPPTLPASIELVRICRQSWDVAHLHGVGFPLVDAASYILRKRSVPYVFTIHGIPASPLRRNGIAAFGLRSYLAMSTCQTAKHAALVTAVSKALLHDSIFPVKHGLVITNGIDHVEPTNAPNGGPLHLLSISRLNVNKGIDVAIRAVGSLNQRGAGIVYDIYGPDGGEEAALRHLVETLGQKHAIRFRGVFAADSRSSVFSRYSALLVPSRVEGFGLAALEAQALGLPVVASRVDGLAEFLDDGNALLVPPDHVESLVGALNKVMHLDVRTRLRESGLTNARRFLWAPIISRYEGGLSSCAGANLPPTRCQDQRSTKRARSAKARTNEWEGLRQPVNLVSRFRNGVTQSDSDVSSSRGARSVE